jgi:hypothetical protein
MQSDDKHINGGIMHTSTEASQLLQDALTKMRSATQVINNLVIEHEYQDVAVLVTQAGAALIEAAVLLLDSKDEDALDALEQADDLLDSVYKIIDGEVDED